MKKMVFSSLGKQTRCYFGKTSRLSIKCLCMISSFPETVEREIVELEGAPFTAFRREVQGLLV